MDKLNFYENLEPFDETKEAAKLLGELASIQGIPEELPISPPKNKINIDKPSIPVLEPPTEELQPSDEDEEIIAARVEEIPEAVDESQIPQPVEPYMPEEELERIDILANQPEAPAFGEEIVSVSSDVPVLMHTLESQQEYAKEVSKSGQIETKPTTLEEYYFGDEQAAVPFEDKMLIEQTLPKIDIEQYLKEEYSEAPEPPANISIPAKDKISIVDDAGKLDSITQTEKPDEDVITAETGKFVLNMPPEIENPQPEEFYSIDETGLPDTKSFTSEYSEEDEIRMGTLPSFDKDKPEDSYKDTDSYSVPQAVEPEFKKAVDLDSPYTEITLQGELPEADRAVPKIEQSEEADKAAEFDLSPDKLKKTTIEDIKLSETDLAIKLKPVDSIEQNIIEKALKEKIASFLPDKTTSEDKDDDTSAVKASVSDDIDKPAMELEERLKSKSFKETKTDVEILKSVDKAIEDTPGEKKSSDALLDEEYKSVVLQFDNLKSKTSKPSKQEDGKSLDLPPFNFPKEEISKDKPAMVDVGGEVEPRDHSQLLEKSEKPSIKKSAELDEYESVLAEAQREAEEFIKDKIKEKDEKKTPAAEAESKNKLKSDTSEVPQSFSDFLSKIKQHQTTVGMKEEPSAEDDHFTKPTLDKPHVPEDIVEKLPIIQREVSPRGPVDGEIDFASKPPSPEIGDLKYDSVPLSADEKEEPVKEPKLKSIFSKLLKKKEKDQNIE